MPRWPTFLLLEDNESDVVLSSLGNVLDIDRAYKLGANSYLIKPLDFERFVEISMALHGYLIWMAQRPDEVATSRAADAAPASPPNATVI